MLDHLMMDLESARYHFERDTTRLFDRETKRMDAIFTAGPPLLHLFSQSPLKIRILERRAA